MQVTQPHVRTTGLADCQKALALYEELGDAPGQAHTWDSIGHAHHHLGDQRQAVTSYQRAIDLYREHGKDYDRSETLIRLGDLYHAAGEWDAAHSAWQQALTTLDGLGHPDAKRLRARLLTLPTRR